MTSSRVGRVLFWTLLGAGVLLAALGTASAAGVTASCSRVGNDDGLGNTRFWYWGTGDSAGTACSTSSDDVLEVGSGDSFTLTCREATTGTSQAATTLTVYAYKDASGFGSFGTTGLVRIDTVTGASCATEQSLTYYCTENGQLGGTPAHGLLKLAVRAQKTTIPTYDIYSDTSGTWGFVWCHPRATAVTDGNPTTSPSVFAGGDTLRTSVTFDSVPYTSGTSTRVDIICGSATNSPGSIAPTTTAVTSDIALKGTTSTWTDGCTLQQKLVITKMSALSGLTNQPLFKWDTSSPVDGLTYNGQEATRTAKPLDRKGTVSGSCPVAIGSETCISRLMRGEIASIGLMITNARGESIPTGTLARATTQRSTQPAYDTTDFLSADFTTSAGSVASYSSTAKTCTPAPCASGATDTNSTPALDYVSQLRLYAAARTDAELTIWGTSAALFDVDTGDTVPVNTWKKTCAGDQTGVFIIASDVIAQNEGPIRDTRGNVVTRSLTVSRTYTEPDTTGADLGADSASTTTGSTTCHTKNPTTPDSANWQFSATATDGNGNLWTSSKTITFLTPYTSPNQLAIIGSAIPTAPGKTMPLQVQCLKADATSIPSPTSCETPRYRVNYTTAAGAWAVHQETTSCASTQLTASTYWCNVTIPLDWPVGRPAVFIAWTNMSGLFVQARADLVVLEPHGDDPLTVNAPDIVLGQVQNLTIASRYDNGTARLGAASNLTVYIIAPDGSLAVNGVNAIETTSPRVGFYHLTFTPTMEGRYVPIVTARTSLGELRTSPATSFRALQPDASQASLDAWFRWNAPKDLPFSNLTTHQTGNKTSLNLSYWNAPASAQVYANATLPPFFNRSLSTSIPIQVTVYPTGLGTPTLETHTLRLTVNGVSATTLVVLNYATENSQSATITFPALSLPEGDGAPLTYTIERGMTSVASTERPTSVYVASQREARSFQSGLRFTPLPNLIGNVTTETALGGLDVDLVRWYNATSGQTMLWQKGNPTGLNDLTRLNRSMALQMRFVRNAEYDIDTGYLSSKSTYLPALVESHLAYLRSVPQTPAEVAAQLAPATAYVITTTDPTTGQFLVYDSHTGGTRTLSQLEPGRAYTIKPDAASTWTVTNP